MPAEYQQPADAHWLAIDPASPVEGRADLGADVAQTSQMLPAPAKGLAASGERMGEQQVEEAVGKAVQQVEAVEAWLGRVHGPCGWWHSWLVGTA